MRCQGFSVVMIASLILALFSAIPAQPAFAEGTVYSVVEDKADDGGGSLGGEMPDGVGGPDPFGYTYIDSVEPGGPTYSWWDISGTGTDMGLSDDSYYWSITLPFTFDFYGTGYTEVAVGSNGVIYFMDVYLGLTNVCLPGDPG